MGQSGTWSEIRLGSRDMHREGAQRRGMYIINSWADDCRALAQATAFATTQLLILSLLRQASSIADFVSDSAEGYKDITTKAMADWDWCAADTDNDGRFPPQSRIDSCRQGVRDNAIDAYLAQTGAIIKRAPDLWPMMEKIVQDCLKSSSIGYF